MLFLAGVAFGGFAIEELADQLLENDRRLGELECIARSQIRGIAAGFHGVRRRWAYQPAVSFKGGFRSYFVTALYTQPTPSTMNTIGNNRNNNF